MRITSLLASVCMTLGLLADGPPVPPALPPATPPAPAAPVVNPFVWDAMSKEITPKAGENSINFTFWVTNTGPTEARIDAVSTSCGCTVSQLPSHPNPWVLKPGESGPLTASMNLVGKFGLVQKLVHVSTSAGQQSLIVRANIPTPSTSNTLSPRERNQLMTLGDRQAVFKGDCVKCHVEPAKDRHGEKLFIAACGICHVSDHRAAMVPDLAAVKTATNADYWRAWVTYGKPGSLMPAFAKEQGGILDEKQIDSLVEYLAKKFPSTVGSIPAALPARNQPPTPPAIPQAK